MVYGMVISNIELFLTRSEILSLLVAEEAVAATEVDVVVVDMAVEEVVDTEAQVAVDTEVEVVADMAAAVEDTEVVDPEDTVVADRVDGKNSSSLSSTWAMASRRPCWVGAALPST